MTVYEFMDSIKTIVHSVLQERGVLTQQWHFGTVKQVNPDGTAHIYIDGAADVSKSIPYNPDISLQTTDKVILAYLNGNKQDAFILSKKRK